MKIRDSVGARDRSIVGHRRFAGRAVRRGLVAFEPAGAGAVSSTGSGLSASGRQPRRSKKAPAGTPPPALTAATWAPGT